MLDLGAFNHPQALKGLKEGVRISRLWYNLRSPLVQNYSTSYEQARRDIEIEEEKSARIKSEQLEEMRRKERRIPSESESGKRAGKSSVIGGISARSRPYPIAQRPQQFQHSLAQPLRPSFSERQREFRQLAAHPYHNAPRVLHTVNSRAERPSQLPSIPARDDIQDNRAVQLIDQSLTYRQYTPLKVSMEELYERIEGRGLLYPPIRVTKPTHRRDKSRFCKFHNTHGHIISQCRDLKTQVKDLVMNRYLDEYVDGVSPVIELQYTRDERVERSLEREQRILVDTGNLVDILFKLALDDMGISDLKLEQTNTSSKEFGGGWLTLMGIIELPITIGSKPFERTMMLDFVVVEE